MKIRDKILIWSLTDKFFCFNVCVCILIFKPKNIVKQDMTIKYNEIIAIIER